MTTSRPPTSSSPTCSPPIRPRRPTSSRRLGPAGLRGFNATGKQYDARFKDGSLVVVAGDTVGCQLDTVRAGYSQVNVGQRPYEMGNRAPDILIDIIGGKAVDNPMYTGLDECTKENVDSCVSG